MANITWNRRPYVLCPKVFKFWNKRNEKLHESRFLHLNPNNFSLLWSKTYHSIQKKNRSDPGTNFGIKPHNNSVTEFQLSWKVIEKNHQILLIGYGSSFSHSLSFPSVRWTHRPWMSVNNYFACTKSKNEIVYNLVIGQLKCLSILFSDEFLLERMEKNGSKENKTYNQ